MLHPVCVISLAVDDISPGLSPVKTEKQRLEPSLRSQGSLEIGPHTHIFVYLSGNI